jgi:hypothetical protein
MKTITIKKSAIALQRTLGRTSEEMATKLGITAAEMKQVLIDFGFTKGRKKAEKPYEIVLQDDTQAMLNIIDSQVSENKDVKVAEDVVSQA